MGALDWLTNSPITQAFGHNGESGNDYGTHFHTPLYLPFGGQVKSVGYGGYGGLVEVATTLPGLGTVTEGVLHLDQIDPSIKVGQTLPGGAFLGLSGGETVQQAAAGLFPGAAHPAQSVFSTGPHTEFYTKLPNGSFTNSATILQVFQNLLGGGTGPDGGGGNAGALSALNPLGTTFDQVKASIANGAERAAFFGLAILVIVLGIVLIAWQPARATVVDPVVGVAQAKGQGIQDAIKGAVKTAAEGAMLA